MMRLILILALFVSTNLYAQEFQPGSYDYLNYQMLSSNIGSDAKPALVIFLTADTHKAMGYRKYCVPLWRVKFKAKRV